MRLLIRKIPSVAEKSARADETRDMHCPSFNTGSSGASVSQSHTLHKVVVKCKLTRGTLYL